MTCEEQPHSSPMEILDVFKILLLKQYLNWTKWLCELRRRKAVCLTLSVSNDLLPHIAIGCSGNWGFLRLLDFRFQWVKSHFANCICFKTEYGNLFHPYTYTPQHTHGPIWDESQLEIIFIGQVHLRCREDTRIARLFNEIFYLGTRCITGYFLEGVLCIYGREG